MQGAMEHINCMAYENWTILLGMSSNMAHITISLTSFSIVAHANGFHTSPQLRVLGQHSGQLITSCRSSAFLVFFKSLEVLK